jgi:hypothetical protein
VYHSYKPPGAVAETVAVFPEHIATFAAVGATGGFATVIDLVSVLTQPRASVIVKVTL